MKKIGAAIILTLISSICAFARIGETESQIKTRYGDAVKPDRSYEAIHEALEVRGSFEKLLFFEKSNFLIAVGFLDGKSVCEIFTRIDRDPISDEELHALLDANSNGQKWAKTENPIDDGDLWFETLGETAFWQDEKVSLAIMQAKLIEKISNEKEQLKGF